MCYESPGPRCFNDSNKKLIKIQAKLERVERDNETANKLLASHAQDGNYAEFARVRKTISTLESRKRDFEVEIRYVQRDVDSTMTGMKKLEEDMKQANTKSEIVSLDNRRRAAQGLRYQRDHALKIKKSGAPPAINFVVPQAA